MVNMIYIIIEKYPHNDYFQVCTMSAGIGNPFVPAVFFEKDIAERFMKGVAFARQDSIIKVKEIDIDEG